MSEEIVREEEEVVETPEEQPEEVELDDDSTDESEEIDLEEEIDWKERALELERQVKKQEKAIRKHKVQVDEPTKAQPSLSEEVVEKKILQSQGMSAELLTQLTKIARVNGTGLIEAQTDPIFIALKEKSEEDAEKAKARLKTSRGSGQVRKGKDFNTKDLTEDEHKQLWRDRQGA